MSSRDITLPDELHSYLERESGRRGYKNVSEFVQSLVEAERHRDVRKEVETLLLEALDSPASEWTEQDVEDIRTTGLKIIERWKSK